jgi:ubiquinone/menaquinone biosynthesis C-methylase UbiE
MPYFDFLAPIYDRFMPSPDPDMWIDLLRLPADGPLLDVGGGTGRIGVELRPLVRSVVISDVSRGMLKRALKKGDVQAVQGDAGRMPFRDGVFARAVMADALHHFPDQEGAVREMVRLLAPGGRLVIEEFDNQRLPVKALALGEKILFMRSRFLTSMEICRMVNECGLIASVRQGPYFSVWIIADKEV